MQDFALEPMKNWHNPPALKLSHTSGIPCFYVAHESSQYAAIAMDHNYHLSGQDLRIKEPHNKTRPKKKKIAQMNEEWLKHRFLTKLLIQQLLSSELKNRIELAGSSWLNLEMAYWQFGAMSGICHSTLLVFHKKEWNPNTPLSFAMRAILSVVPQCTTPSACITRNDKFLLELLLFLNTGSAFCLTTAACPPCSPAARAIRKFFPSSPEEPGQRLMGCSSICIWMPLILLTRI